MSFTHLDPEKYVKTEYRYEYVPTIRAFSRDDSFIRGLMGPFGSGKSVGCLMELIRRGCAQTPGPDGMRRTRWAVIRNTYPQLRDTTQKTVFDWIPERRFGKFLKAENTYTITGVQEDAVIEILFRALDRPDHVANLLSLELTGAWVNEAREVPWAIVEGLTGRVGRYPSRRNGVGATWYGIIMDTNPPDDDSEWYKFFEEKRPENARIFKQPSGLSPDAENLQNLPPGYYTTIASGKERDWVKVYVHAEYGRLADGKPVYTMYRDHVHSGDVPVIPKMTIIRGWDFGLTPACAMVQVSSRGQFRIFDEMVSERAGIDQFSDEVVKYCGEKYPGYEFLDIGDPAGMAKAQTDERSCFDIMHGKGIEIQPGIQNMAIRLESVRRALNSMIDGEPGLIVDKRCKYVRKGFNGGYQYRKLAVSGTDRYTEKPDKNRYSHIHDAVQYVASIIFGDLMRGFDTIPGFPGGYEDEDDDFGFREPKDKVCSMTGY